MTLQEAYEKRRQEVLSLQRQVKKLQKDLDEASAGLYTPVEKVEFLKKINSLTVTMTGGTGNEKEICTTILAGWTWKKKTPGLKRKTKS